MIKEKFLTFTLLGDYYLLILYKNLYETAAINDDVALLSKSISIAKSGAFYLISIYKIAFAYFFRY